MTKPKKSKNKGFDTHQAFSIDEVKAVLRFFNLPEDEYWDWMYGQTCPLSPTGELAVYWYDLHRYIIWKVKGVVPVWD